ncbi:MAG: 50S ribosomal protein L15 [Alphaproteobacteria bacterium]|jgi:large subunit ribosomal protein L15|nr:50S ribosomal protein L15 [Alphaproteobacteria bacterium]
MKLNMLSDNKGAKSSKMRVGRGIGSGKGKTAGRGHKGQKSREGVSINGFEGGQTPLHRRLPTRGFSNFVFKKVYAVVTLEKLQAAVDSKKLKASAKINEATLVEAGVISKAKNGVKVIAKGEVKSALKLEVAKCSDSAKEAVEKAGGSVKLIEAKKVEGKLPAKNKEKVSRLEKKNKSKK